MVGAVPIRTFFHPLFPQPADQSFTNLQKDSLFYILLELSTRVENCLLVHLFCIIFTVNLYQKTN